MSDVLNVIYEVDFIGPAFQHEQETRRFWAACAFGDNGPSDSKTLLRSCTPTRLAWSSSVAVRTEKSEAKGNRKHSTSLASRIDAESQRRTKTFRVERQTIKQRLRTTLKRISDALRRNRHRSIPEEGKWLGQVIRGYCAYHAVPLNMRLMNVFRQPSDSPLDQVAAQA
jgi:RNA-directed DNA polymerase